MFSWQDIKMTSFASTLFSAVAGKGCNFIFRNRETIFSTRVRASRNRYPARPFTSRNTLPDWIDAMPNWRLNQVDAHRHQRLDSLWPQRRNDVCQARAPVVATENGLHDFQRVHKVDHIAGRP